LGVLAAQKRGIKNIINSTFDEVGFKKKSIDAVGLFDVLEHIKDDLSLLQAINCPLKKGGFLFLTVPSYNWLWSHEDVYAGHYRRYRLTKLKNLLLAAGFKIRYSSYFFSFLPPFIFIKRRLPFLLFGSQPVSAQTINRDHAGNHSNSWLLTRLLDAELKFVNNLNSIPIGSSCIVVAQKL
jgi:SAM-dependent methyltransferase